MDIVYIHGLEIKTLIGIFDWERKMKQTVSVDLEMAADVRPAAERDEIGHALDYNAVSKRLIQYVGDSEFQLIETLAERIAALVREEFDVPWLRLRLGKPGAISGSRGVGVLIERGSREPGQVSP